MVIHNIICHAADIIWIRGKKAIIGGLLMHGTALMQDACLLIIKNPQFKTYFVQNHPSSTLYHTIGHLKALCHMRLFSVFWIVT